MSRIKEHIKELYKITTGDQKNYYGWLHSKGLVYDCEIKDIGKELMKEAFKSIPKACYTNSLKISLFNENLDYVEGFYITSVINIPLEHAWNSKGGKYFDSTAIMMGFKVRERFGVKLPRELYLIYALDEESNKHMGFLKWYYINYIKVNKIIYSI